jgi:hypothetical protein
MICAASYMGPNAPTLACQLAEQIRSKHHVPAYIFNRAQEERRREQEEYERACRAAQEQGIPVLRRRFLKIQEQCAVLIAGPKGGWSDADAASSYMKKVRQWPLPELHLDNGLPAYDMQLRVRPDPHDPKMGKAEPDGVPINPFQTCFVTRNPTVPQAAKPQNKFDPYWKKLNANEDYSLLKCPKLWTLVVKEYIGAAAVQPRSESSSFLDKIGLGGLRMGEGISAAGLQAHHLAEFMKKLGFEAYVLHTRTSSIVTIGGFDSLQDPEMERTQDRLSRLSFRADPTSANAAQFAHTNLELFPRAMPMEVPRP